MCRDSVVKSRHINNLFVQKIGWDGIDSGTDRCAATLRAGPDAKVERMRDEIVKRVTPNEFFAYTVSSRDDDDREAAVALLSARGWYAVPRVRSCANDSGSRLT